MPPGNGSMSCSRNEPGRSIGGCLRMRRRRPTPDRIASAMHVPHVGERDRRVLPSTRPARCRGRRPSRPRWHSRGPPCTRGAPCCRRPDPSSSSCSTCFSDERVALDRGRVVRLLQPDPAPDALRLDRGWEPTLVGSRVPRHSGPRDARRRPDVRDGQACREIRSCSGGAMPSEPNHCDLFGRPVLNRTEQIPARARPPATSASGSSSSAMAARPCRLRSRLSARSGGTGSAAAARKAGRSAASAARSRVPSSRVTRRRPSSSSTRTCAWRRLVTSAPARPGGGRGGDPRALAGVVAGRGGWTCSATRLAA